MYILHVSHIPKCNYIIHILFTYNLFPTLAYIFNIYITSAIYNIHMIYLFYIQNFIPIRFGHFHEQIFIENNSRQ